MKSALYARVSTTHNDQITSFNMQQKYSNDNFNILAIYGEQTSGRQLYKRREQQRLLNDCGIEITFIPQQTTDKDGNIKKLKTKKSLFILTERQPLYECIIVSNTSRWGRNIIEVKEMIEALHNKGMVLWFDDLGKFSNATDLSLTLDLLFLLDENYSKQVSEKVNRGLERARKENYLHMHTNFFGMDYIKGKNKLVPNGDSQTIINVFNEYKNGASIRTLAAKYNKTQSRVKDILDNPKFAGYNFYGKYIGDSSSRRVPIDQLELIPCFDRITPIISFELWNQCQDIKRSRKCGTRGVNNSSYPLSSKIICNDCGTSFFHKSKNKKPNTDLWKCRKVHNEPHLCKMPSISESSIIKYLKSDYGLKAIRNTLEFKINLDKENTHRR